MNEKKILILFQSIHYVIKAEKICLKTGIPCRIIPVPKEVSSECGMAIQIEESHKDTFETTMNQKGISFRICYNQ